MPMLAAACCCSSGMPTRWRGGNEVTEAFMTSIRGRRERIFGVDFHGAKV